MNTGRISVGAMVRAEYRGGYVGTVLAIDDPRAWANTLAFPCDDPDPEAVRKHVRKCQSRGLLRDDRWPILWDFDDGARVYWDRRLTVIDSA